MKFYIKSISTIFRQNLLIIIIFAIFIIFFSTSKWNYDENLNERINHQLCCNDPHNLSQFRFWNVHKYIFSAHNTFRILSIFFLFSIHFEDLMIIKNDLRWEILWYKHQKYYIGIIHFLLWDIYDTYIRQKLFLLL